jgi:hypothetical protein
VGDRPRCGFVLRGHDALLGVAPRPVGVKHAVVEERFVTGVPPEGVLQGLQHPGPGDWRKNLPGCWTDERQPVLSDDGDVQHEPVGRF